MPKYADRAPRSAPAWRRGWRRPLEEIVGGRRRAGAGGAAQQRRRIPQRVDRQHLHVEPGDRAEHVGHAPVAGPVRGRAVAPRLRGQADRVVLGDDDELVGGHVAESQSTAWVTVSRIDTVRPRGRPPSLTGSTGPVPRTRAPERRTSVSCRREVGDVAPGPAAPRRRDHPREQSLEVRRRLPRRDVAELVVDAARLFFGAPAGSHALERGQGQDGGPRDPGPPGEKVRRREHAVAGPDAVVEEQAGARVHAGTRSVGDQPFGCGHGRRDMSAGRHLRP